MPSIRKTKTSSGAIAVQVVRYEQRRVVVMKHLGSAHTSEEISALVESAEAWMMQEAAQPALFTSEVARTLRLASLRHDGVSHTFAREALLQIVAFCGLAALCPPLILDLALMRLIEPVSKRRSLKLIKQYFGISYAERTLYRFLPAFIKHKPAIEQQAVACARSQLKSDLSLVLYDVTTLYFESFDPDDLRKPGFSKDNKPNQPQIIVGLLVDGRGFPLGYEVFKGNTFEGHTMLPVVEAFAKLHAVATMTVVADAAMMGLENIREFKKRNLSYIVGARIANLSPLLIRKISAALPRKDGATIRMPTDHGDLVCGFSAKRFRKDRVEMEKQIAKAKQLIKSREPGKRAKFVAGSARYELNEALITKTTSLLGIKGYYTNIPPTTMNDTDIIARYHDLWHVEQAFRMAKSDLATRPIFHHVEASIKAHILLCFVALAVGKYIEIETRSSLRRTVDLLWGITDVRIIDTTTSEAFTLRSEIPEETEKILTRLRVSY